MDEQERKFIKYLGFTAGNKIRQVFMMILFLDTETTGLPNRRSASFYHLSNWPRLVEIAWIECNENGTVESEYDRIINRNHLKSQEVPLHCMESPQKKQSNMEFP